MKKRGNPRYSLVLGVSRSQTMSMHFALKGLIESLDEAPLKTSGRQQNEFDQTTAKLETRNLNARCYWQDVSKMAAEVLLNTSYSQISIASQTMMSQNVTKFYNRHAYTGKPVHCPAAFGTWDWKMALIGKHTIWKIREIRAHLWFS